MQSDWTSEGHRTIIIKFFDINWQTTVHRLPSKASKRDNSLGFRQGWQNLMDFNLVKSHNFCFDGEIFSKSAGEGPIWGNQQIFQVRFQWI